MIDIKLLVYKLDNKVVNIRYEDMSDQDKNILLKIAEGIESCDHSFVEYLSTCGKRMTKRCRNCGRSWTSLVTSSDQ